MAKPKIYEIIDGVYTKLNANASLKAELGDGVIYSGFNVKASATRPYLLIKPPQGLEDVGAKDCPMFRFELQVLIVVDDQADTESSLNMEQITQYVVEDLHSESLTLATANHVLTNLVSLNQTPSSDDLLATTLTFEILIS